MAFHRTPLDVVTLAGTATEVAFALGKKRVRRIAPCIDHWNEKLAGLFHGKRAKLKALEKAFLAAATAHAPSYVEEIRAMAEGAGVPFPDLFRLNLTELKRFAEKCSTLIFKTRSASDNAVLIAHNEDWEPAQNDVFVLRARLPDVSYAILTYDGYIPGLSSGFNSHGLYHAVNFVLAKDIRPGVPRSFITRHLVTARSAKDCLAWIRNMPRAFGQSIHLAERGRYVGIELTAKKLVIRNPNLPTIHTNHYLAPSLRRVAAPATENTLTRLKVGRRLLREVVSRRDGKPWSPAQAESAAKTILSDRSGLPYAIWREADRAEDVSATVAAVLLRTDKNTMEVHRGRPAAGKALVVGLP
jgi:isopenicillin-N N-acyltransferase-like protein